MHPFPDPIQVCMLMGEKLYTIHHFFTWTFCIVGYKYKCYFKLFSYYIFLVCYDYSPKEATLLAPRHLLIAHWFADKLTCHQVIPILRPLRSKCLYWKLENRMHRFLSRREYYNFGHCRNTIATKTSAQRYILQTCLKYHFEYNGSINLFCLRYIYCWA